MFGRSAKTAALLLLLSAGPALAKKQNFVGAFPFGLGFVAGGEKGPRSSFVTGTQTRSSDFGNYFAAEPFFDYVNLAVRLHASWHFYPQLHGSGNDSIGNFTESSDAGSFHYGVRVLLAPFVNQALDQRAYFVVGVTQAVVKLKNARKYSSGGIAGQTNTERLEGKGLDMSYGVGYEFFLIQNYSLQIEAGYLERSVDAFGYKSTTDLAGAPRADGEEATNANGTKKGFHVWGPYVQIVLNLNL